MSVGVIVARLQPMHNGHLALIEKSMHENTDTYLFIGSANKLNRRNPIPISVRLDIARNATEYMKEKFVGKTLHIIPLNDLMDETNNTHDWGFYLYSTIVSNANTSNFTIYYSDGFEIITTWFPPFILKNNVSLNLIARNSCVSGISSTKIREYILNDKCDELVKFVPKVVFDMKDIIKNYIIVSKDIN